MKNIINNLKGKKIHIYGAGYDAKLVYHILEVNELNVELFFVDDGYLNDTDYRSTKIIELSNFISIVDPEDLVLICMNNVSERLNIKDKLQCLIYEFSRKIINDLLEYNAKAYLQKYEIETNSEFISLTTHDNIPFRIINPYALKSDVYRIAFNLELPDLIIPVIDTNFKCMSEGKYEYDEVVVRPNDVVIDCGANIGLFSSISASKKGVVYAFEPVKELIDILKRIENIYPNIKVVPMAVGDIVGKVKFSISGINTTSHSFYNNDQGSNISEGVDKEVWVDCTTLDDFVSLNNLKRVDFIKADIEGAERLMLSGAKNVLKQFAPKLSICTYHFHDDKEVLEKLFLSANPNYVIIHKWQKLFAYVP
jgi:FkbM family methyltransferase